MIYLASPYSDPDHSVRVNRFKQVCKVAGNLIKEGHIVYSPIAHSHSINEICSLPDYFDWIKFDSYFLKLCSKLYVLMLIDWEKSKGIDEEIKLAKKLKKPIAYISLGDYYGRL